MIESITSEVTFLTDVVLTVTSNYLFIDRHEIQNRGANRGRNKKIIVVALDY